ncbi:MAG: ATP-binding cassette domain-containing protein [Eubacteriales bacterium]|nr:ATP-binding cassette domain-containing protein [Eubacteriales bacterium]
MKDETDKKNDRNNILLEVKGVKKYFSGKKGCVKALDGVDLTIKSGELVSIVGESGCGKSTLSRCIIGIEKITEGEIFFNGEKISDYDRKQLRPVRRIMQMVFQNPYAAFQPKQTIGEGLREVGNFYGIKGAELQERLDTLLEYIKMDAELLDHYPDELSGGQLQRLAIARALIVKPKLLIADEPVSALDVSVQAQILNILSEIQKKENMAVLFISHDLSVVEHISDRVYVMYLGKAVESGDKKDIFSDPKHQYTKALLASRPRETPWEKSCEINLKGELPNALNIPDGCRFWPRCVKYKDGLCNKYEPKTTISGNGHMAACHLVETF